MKHTKLSNNINKMVGEILPEIALERFDELDEGLQYSVVMLDGFNDLLKKSNKMTVDFYNNDLERITTQTKEDTYVIYYSKMNDNKESFFKVGEMYVRYDSLGHRYHAIKSRADIYNISVSIILKEKMTIECDKVKSLSRTIYININ